MKDGHSFVIEGGLNFPYRYFVGKFAKRFFDELRDSCRIMGLKCRRCKKIIVPPRKSCIFCFELLKDWVELGKRGKIITYTIVNYSEPHHPHSPPVVLGIIKLDGSDTGLCHLIDNSFADSLKIGMEVEAVFKQERSGNIMDIKFFRPTGR